jgi:hypothetical protein
MLSILYRPTASREIHSDFHRRREPYEPLPEFDVGSDFFERGKNDLEVA